MVERENSSCDVKVTVVVPVYNTQTYLRECIDSILAQTLSEIEILCIDDGSTDECPAILDLYAEQDIRIRVFHIANGGYGHAVNMGMDHAAGKYISIVEPDDYIEKGMLERLYTVSEKYELDFVSADNKEFTGEDKERIFKICNISGDSGLYNVVINPFEEREIFKGGFINPAGLFNRKFLNDHHIRHNETPGAAFQDAGFGFLVLAYAKKMMILPDAFYCYRQDNPGSSINNNRKVNCIIEEYKYILARIKNDEEHLGSFMAEYTRRKVGSYLNMYDRLIPDLRLEYLNLISRDFREALERGEWIITMLSKNQEIQVKLIMEDPEAFYNRDAMLRDEIHRKGKDFDVLIIYGVGVFGKKTYDVMADEDKSKVQGFAVTDSKGNIAEYKGVPVKPIDLYSRNTPVIVGVTDRYEKEIVLALRERGWETIICLDTKKWFQNL